MIRRIIVIAVLVLGLGGLIAYSQYRPEPNRVSGFVEADEIRVGSRIGGRVAVVHVEEGQRVEVGQVLVELEPFDLRQRENEAKDRLAVAEAALRRLNVGLRPEEVAQAKARLDQFQAQLDRLRNGPRKEEIEAARGRLRTAEAQLRLARAEYDRVQAAFDRGSVTQANFDDAVQKLDSAEGMQQERLQELALLEAGTREETIREATARVEEAQQAWELAKSGFRQEEIDQAQATRDAAQAALEVIQAQAAELTIKSPVNGVIEALDLQVGDLLPSSAPALSILDDGHLWVRAYIPQNRVALSVGEKLWISVDAAESERILGEITFISRQAEFTPSNVQTPEERSKQVFRVKVALPDDAQNVRPGMTADVLLEPAGES